MCVIFLIFGIPSQKLVLASNRDEVLTRPSRRAHFWDVQPEVIAGVDLLHHPLGSDSEQKIPHSICNQHCHAQQTTQTTAVGTGLNTAKWTQIEGYGTWLGITRRGRFAAVTNYREHLYLTNPSFQKSRGFLVRDFLVGDMHPEAYVAGLTADKHAWGGFNLIVGDLGTKGNDGEYHVWYFGNREDVVPMRLNAGTVYGLSNGTMLSCWPKVELGKAIFEKVVETAETEKELLDGCSRVLDDKTVFPDHMLPRQNPIERALCSISIDKEAAATALPSHMVYGTKTNTIVLVDDAGRGVFWERERYDEAGNRFGLTGEEQHTLIHRFRLQS